MEFGNGVVADEGAVEQAEDLGRGELLPLDCKIDDKHKMRAGRRREWRICLIGFEFRTRREERESETESRKSSLVPCFLRTLAKDL